jgi:Tfp pilus assembly protein PilV
MIARHRDDRGETLLELVITTLIIGVAFTALLLAAGAAVDASRFHNRQVEARLYLRTWAESIERSSGSGYRGCPTGVTAGTIAAPGGVPSEVTTAAPVVQVWNGSAWVNCAAATSDPGWQRVTLRVTISPGVLPSFSETLQVAVRQP